MTQSHFLISAPASNSGKTTLTLGLLRALTRRNLKVQPFKCGPDYIDPIHHTEAAGNQSINLDTFMSSNAHVQALYEKYSAQSDVSVTEGVMGLFDGAQKMDGSSAAIAELLGIPVVLVVDARSMAYSAAALLYGFKNFYPQISIAGVIFNFVGTESHYRFLQDACADAGVEALGYLSKNSALAIPSRHLGLHISAETDYEQIIESAAHLVEQTVNLDRLLELTRVNINPGESSPVVSVKEPGSRLKVTIARDEAFTFTYHQNIEALAGLGHITWFSPIHDHVLPETDFLYIPGGYPELHAAELSENESMRASIKAYCDGGGLAFAECGGLMYLGEQLTNAQGDTFEMAGALPCSTSMLHSKMVLGYRTGNWDGVQFNGHEFHYSGFTNNSLTADNALITNARGIETDTKLYRKNNTFGTYMHIYWGETQSFLENLISKSRQPTANSR
ncbi:cobyrinate a,c-diamide synthase [Dyadobacter sp. Leaf189]|uniref:cobyrinate a,c-diamide synthase n=1 Tax=Dyadobacter sp. Leaf189 TaxID=1736295 RepID=UPI0006F937FB|nr:cobyrinate a,c-diamide synthase [Dyadobacter sp. Leaf189]KQS31539.1 cobyrinic acid a,c-diamide synthase [Dyadobacter sp. Leaf189]